MGSNELHVFSDRSEKTCAATVYSRTVNGNSDAHVELLAAKSKVSPIRSPSLLKLDFHAAQFSARLIGIHFSTIVLSWLSDHPSAWSCSVGNRVTDIQSRIPPQIWNQVKTADNSRFRVTRTLSRRIAGIRLMVEKSSMALRRSKPMVYSSRTPHCYCPERGRQKLTVHVSVKVEPLSCQRWALLSVQKTHCNSQRSNVVRSRKIKTSTSWHKTLSLENKSSLLYPRSQTYQEAKGIQWEIVTPLSILRWNWANSTIWWTSDTKPATLTKSSQF